MNSTDILIIGSSISAQLAASYLRKQLPSLKVTFVGPTRNQRPIVGESTISVTARFLTELGLGEVLVEKHYPKYALTYYYKDRIDDPADRTYHVSESPFVLPELSHNLNRFTFDEQLRAHALELGAEFLPGKVDDVELGPGVKRVTVTSEAGGSQTIEARWLIDASGRNRFLARKLGLGRDCPPFIAQRSTFWFRLRGFDRRILSRIDAIKKKNRSYSSYYCTHHFIGRGNWIWCIPMRAPDNVDLISIGICYREDLHPEVVHDMPSFLDSVGREHPVLAELVRSGEVVDEQQYRRYMYDCAQMYSADGWYLIGDAARPVDPLYSTGMANTTEQVQQVTELIRRSHAGEDCSEVTRVFEEFMRGNQYGNQGDISALYEVMDDRFQCQSRMHLSTVAFFHAVAPFIANGYHFDPDGCRELNELFGPTSPLSQQVDELFAMIERVARAGNVPEDAYPEVQDVEAFNVEYYAHLRRADIPRSIARLTGLLGTYREHLEGLLAKAASPGAP